MTSFNRRCVAPVLVSLSQACLGTVPVGDWSDQRYDPSLEIRWGDVPTTSRVDADVLRPELPDPVLQNRQCVRPPDLIGDRRRRHPYIEHQLLPNLRFECIDQ